ncbi:hypothetical protein MKK63_02445 [Methylobacterium sp. J-088]|uniref:hypothetical protein n=1 Tax=unclassified Methylobacterium TaxID=2615210 RepID=UPI001FBAD55D|nr:MULTISPECIES: hypothetical protein [unclassified Methylobacterium]MCJ2061573.1 hypothetical protein [Methylobacterium sp. J-088]
MNRSILALLIVATTLTDLSAARAQDRTGADPKAETATKPAADTRDPGKTATEAVTNPATVPPTEGAVGSGKPPVAGTPPTTGR